MSTEIYPITPEHLDPGFLRDMVYPSGQDLCWSGLWDRDFYRSLARAGFISTCLLDQSEYLLLPEIQTAYAVLDWPDVHRSRQVKRLLRSGALSGGRVRLAINQDLDPVLRGLAESWGASSWLHPPYADLLRGLASDAAAAPGGDFMPLAVELRCGEGQELVGGELGYCIGRTWTSLSGFLRRDNPAWDNFGTIQLLALAEVLRRKGFAFWNLGHPHMEYKLRLGARILARDEFLERWSLAIREELPSGAVGLAGQVFECQSLLEGMEPAPVPVEAAHPDRL